MKQLTIATLAASLTASVAFAEDITLTMWTESSNAPESVFAQEFSDMDNGIKIDVREVRFDDLVAETLRAFATRTNPDIIAIDNPDHAAFASRRRLSGPDRRMSGSRIRSTWTTISTGRARR